MSKHIATRRAGGRGRVSDEPSRAAGLTEDITRTTCEPKRDFSRDTRGSRLESADAYRGSIVRLDDRFRVIVCKDGWQWIVQRRDGWRAGAPRWAGFQYHRTRKALIAACRGCCGLCDPAAMARLALLPEVIGRAAT